MNDTPRLTSRGEIEFDPAIDADTRAAILDMWQTRLTGFRENNLKKYLRDNTRETTYSMGRLRVNGATFYWLSWFLFVLRVPIGWIGITISADIHDAAVSPRDDGFVTKGMLCVSIRSRVIRRKMIDMMIVRDNDQWRWGDVVVTAA